MTSKEEKILQLKKAMEEFDSRGSDLFDHQLEESKADVRRRALLLLDQRARSCDELRKRLLNLDFEPKIVEMVLEDLQRSKLLDDAAFASEWVRQRHARRGKSRSVLNQELKEKGISAAERAHALEQVDEDSEEQIARSLATKKARSVKAVPEDWTERDKALRRIVGVLARRGFSQSMSLRIAKQALDERIAELG